jgi:hypothetical protein
VLLFEPECRPTSGVEPSAHRQIPRVSAATSSLAAGAVVPIPMFSVDVLGDHRINRVVTRLNYKSRYQADRRSGSVRVSELVRTLRSAPALPTNLALAIRDPSA